MAEVDKKATKKPSNASKGFTAEEKAAMRQRAKEQQAEAKAEASRADGENEVRTAIAAMSEPDRAMAKRVHAIITAGAPTLAPKTWYGQPAYARDGKIICFFQPAGKFKTRYATLGFTDSARLDDGAIWPVAFALKELTAAEEAKIAALVQQALS